MVIRNYQAYELPHYVTPTLLWDLSLRCFTGQVKTPGFEDVNPGLDATPSAKFQQRGLHHSTSQQRNSLLPSYMDPAILFSFSWKRCQAVWALLVRSPLRCLSSFKPFTRSGAQLSATTNWRLKKKRKKKQKIRRKLEDKTDLEMKQVAFSFTYSCHHEYWNVG